MINPMHLWFYGFKVHVLAALSSYILHYVTTPASGNDFKEVAALLERCQQSVIVADLGYLSQQFCSLHCVSNSLYFKFKN